MMKLADFQNITYFDALTNITFLDKPFTGVDTSKIVRKLIPAMEAVSTTDYYS